MAEQFTVKCPFCGGTLNAQSEAEAIKIAKQHAKDNHQTDLTDEQAKGLITQQPTKAK